MRRTKEEALITRENVLTAALEVFSRDGYSDARLEDIADAAEVTRGAIYHHFGSKEELYVALVTERSAGINQIAEEILSRDGPAFEIIRDLLVGLLGYGAENQEYRALLEMATSKVGLTERLGSIQEDTIRGRRQMAAYFEQLLERGKREGDVRSDLAVRPAAWGLLGFLNGVGLMWIQDPRAFSLREDTEALVDSFLRGIEA